MFLLLARFHPPRAIRPKIYPYRHVLAMERRGRPKLAGFYDCKHLDTPAESLDHPCSRLYLDFYTLQSENALGADLAISQMIAEITFESDGLSIHRWSSSMCQDLSPGLHEARTSRHSFEVVFCRGHHFFPKLSLGL